MPSRVEGIVAALGTGQEQRGCTEWGLAEMLMQASCSRSEREKDTTFCVCVGRVPDD